MNIDLHKLPPIIQDNFKPLYAQLSEAILTYIKIKGLKPGDPLPSESDLVTHYGISRMTVRFAIQRLATEGILKKKQGVGTFVAEKKISSDIWGIRSLEVNLKSQGIEVENFLLEAGISDLTIRLWTSELQLPEESRLFKIRCLKKIKGKPFAVEVRFIPADIAGLFSLDQLTTQPLIELFNSHINTKICRVAYRTRSELLLEHYTSDLEVDSGSAGLVQFATYFNIREQPVMTGKLVFLGEKMELCYEFSSQEKDQSTGFSIPEVSLLTLPGNLEKKIFKN